MIGFEKSHFRWKDPGRKLREPPGALRKSLFRLLGVSALSAAVFLMVLRSMYGISLTKPLAVLAAILLFMVVIYLIHAHVPPYVVVKDTHMYRGLNDETAEEWKYKDISGCRFSSTIIEGIAYPTMEIETTDGERSQILVAPGISLDALRSFLLAKGIKEIH